MKPIERFKEDGERTAFSAGVMNEIIDAINSLILMRGEGGTKVYKAESGFVIYSSGSIGSSESEAPPTTVIYDGRDTWL